MKSKTVLSVLFCLLSTFAFAGDFVIYPNGITKSTNTWTGCPNGTFIANATYAMTISNGWGWAPDTNNFTMFTATFANQPGVTVQYTGKNLDSACGITVATIPNPPPSPKYRFTVWWPVGSTVPTSTNQCPLTLHGFVP